MSYLVMECHPGYAVVLDQDDRFLKVANLNYDVGQTVLSVMEMSGRADSGNRKPTGRRFAALASLAACLGVVLLGSWHEEESDSQDDDTDEQAEDDPDEGDEADSDDMSDEEADDDGDDSTADDGGDDDMSDGEGGDDSLEDADTPTDDERDEDDGLADEGD